MNNDKIPCTVGVLTLNNAATIERCLKSVQEFAEVIVIDGNSTDKTLEIARKFNNVRIARQFDSDELNQVIQNFSQIRAKLLNLASYDWYLSLDSDEAASPELVTEVKGIINEPEGVYVYNVPSKFILDGEVIEHASGYPGYEIYFFNKRVNPRYVKNVHEVVEFDEQYRLGALKAARLAIFNEEDTDFKIWKNKMRKYIKMEMDRTNDKSFWYFLKWRVAKQFWMITKAVLKITLLYLRYGFKKTLPPRLQFQRVYFYVWLTWAYFVKYFKGKY